MTDSFLDMTIEKLGQFFSKRNNITFINIIKILLEMAGCVIGVFISLLLFLTASIWAVPYLIYKNKGGSRNDG